MTNKDLLYSIGNATQYSVMTHMRKESKKYCIYIYTYKLKHEYKFKIGEGNGYPLQYSCLENPMDGGAW